MNEQREDRRLRQLFDEAHRDDRAPSFLGTWNAARQRRMKRSQLWALIPAVAVAALLIIWSVRPRPSSVPASNNIPRLEWSAPLDFLLQTPGSELLTTVPTFNTDRSLQ